VIELQASVYQASHKFIRTF